MEVVRCEKLLEELTSLVKEIKEHFAALRDKPEEDDAITDDDTSLQKFCAVLEKILRHGIKEKMTLFSGHRDFWKYLSVALEQTRSFEPSLKAVQDMEEVTTSLGKGRALVRVLLAEHSLADAVQHASSGDKHTVEWYQENALLRNEKHASRFIDQLYELSDVNFILSNDGQSLDSAWPTFARRTFSGGSAVPISINPSRGGSSSGGGGVGVVDTAELGQAALGELAVDEALVKDDGLSASVLWAGQGIQAMDRTCWTALHFLLHWMMNRKMGEDCGEGLPEHGSQRLKEFVALVMLARDNWQVEHEKRLVVVEKRCEALDEQLEEKINTEIALRAELAAMQQNGVNFAQGQAVAEVEALQTKLKQAEKARDSAKQITKSLEQEVAEARKENATLQRDVVREAESLASVKEQLTFIELECAHSKEDLENELRTAKGRVVSLQSQLQSAGDFLDTLVKSPSQPTSPTGSVSPTRRLDLLGRLQMLNSSLQEEMQRRTRAEERERESAGALVGTKARLDQELSTVSFRLTAEGMQLQHALEQNEIKEKELSLLKERLVSTNKDHEQTRTEIGTVRVENARLTAEKQTLVDKVGRLQSGLMTSQQELMALEEQLLATTRERDAERADSLKLSSQFDQVKEKCAHAESKMKEHLDEAHLLRRQLLQASQQKAELVNKTADLENEVITRAAEMWVEDEKADACMLCATEFTFFTRRHHCRNCGRVYCHECCCKTFQLPCSDQPSRVCNECHTTLASRRQGVAKARVYSLMTESQASVALTASMRPQQHANTAMPVYKPPVVEHPSTVAEKSASTVSLNSLRQKPVATNDHGGSMESVASVTEGGRIVLDDSAEESLVSPNEETNTSIRAAMQSGSAQSLSSRNSSARSTPVRELFPANRVPTPERPATPEQRGPAAPAPRPAGVFLPTSTSTPKARRLRTADSSSSLASPRRHFQLVPDMSVGPSIKSEFTSVSVQPGGMVGDALSVPKAGMRIVWQFRSEPRGIAFGVLYQTTPTEDAEAVVVFKRYLSHKQTIQGSVAVPQPGIYTLQFSNVTSSNTACRLWYRQELRSA